MAVAQFELKSLAARKFLLRLGITVVVLGLAVYIAYYVRYQRPLARYFEMHAGDHEYSSEEARSRLHDVLRAPTYGLHDAFLDAQYLGDWSTVPLLIECLKWQGETASGQSMICTKAHCLSSLRAITGQFVGQNYVDWIEWWRTAGKNLPPESRAPTMNSIEAIAQSDSIYRRELKANPPDDPVAMIEALRGANAQAKAYLVLAKGKNVADLLVDQWRTPFRFTRGEKDRLVVTSAGPDALFGTADDLPPRRQE